MNIVENVCVVTPHISFSGGVLLWAFMLTNIFIFIIFHYIDCCINVSNNNEKECRKPGRNAVLEYDHRRRSSSFLRLNMSCLCTKGNFAEVSGCTGAIPLGMVQDGM